MTFASSHHHLVAILAGVGGAFLIILLVLALRKRAPKAPEPQEDLQSQLEERLATGRFSRAPSNWRRKAVVDPVETVPIEKPDDELHPASTSTPESIEPTDL